MPLLHARDAAMGKVAAIGTVNPRPGGLVNSLVQAWKRLVARVLDWHVREQVEFNRQLLACVDAQIEALNAVNRELDAPRHYLAQWRAEWESRAQQNEVQFLRNIADLQGAFQHRTTLMDANYRDAIRAQHVEFTAALERSAQDIQKRLWADLEHIRLEYERLIYSELRTIRQRAQVTSALAAGAASKGTAPAALSPAQPQFDYGRFAERFRGPEEYVKAGQAFYSPYFAGCRNVLDIGCGRGEFLEMMRAAGVPARGIDLAEESVALCRHKGLEAERADLFDHLDALPESSLDGIFCSQVVEHLPPERLPEMVRLYASRLARGGVLAVETPNPECLAIFATHFYLDPTHTRPVPPPLLAFYMEEYGMGNIEVKRLSPAVESNPSLASLPEDVRQAFFGSLDYAILARKL
jgi:O-antigen chain-terminating methyltransferase